MSVPGCHRNRARHATLPTPVKPIPEPLMEWKRLDRITLDPTVMGGKPCIRGLRVTVGMIVGMIASGHDQAEPWPFTPIWNRTTSPRH